MQHNKYFEYTERQNNEGEPVEPRQAIYEDLREGILRWKELNKHIILGLDVNKDRHTEHTNRFKKI